MTISNIKVPPGFANAESVLSLAKTTFSVLGCEPVVSTHDEAIEGTTAIDKELAEARTNNEVATRKAEEARAKLEAQRAVLEKAQVNVTKASVAKRLADDDFALKSAAFKLAKTDMARADRMHQAGFKRFELAVSAKNAHDGVEVETGKSKAPGKSSTKAPVKSPKATKKKASGAEEVEEPPPKRPRGRPPKQNGGGKGSKGKGGGGKGGGRGKGKDDTTPILLSDEEGGEDEAEGEAEDPADEAEGKEGSGEEASDEDQ